MAGDGPVALLGSNGELADPTELLIERTLTAVREEDPDLAETVRACAVPKKVDATVVGVVRHTPNDPDGNRRVREALAALDFVSENADGSLVFDDGARDRLIASLRADDRARFEAVSDRLVGHFEAAHDAALVLDRDLGAVARPMREVARARHTELLETVARLVRVPLLDALYHAILKSPEAGYDFFERHYVALEESMRFNVCATLLGAAELDFGQVHGPDRAASWLRLLRYWEARLARGMNDVETAEEILRSLRATAGEDPDFDLWVAGELGDTLVQQFRLREALDAYGAQADAEASSRPDGWNVPVSLMRLGHLYTLLGELDPAVENYRAAATRARQVGNERAHVVALAGLARSLVDRGEWDAAAEPALRALELARTGLRTRPDLQLNVVRLWMRLLSPLSPELLDSTWREARELAGDMGGPLARLDLGVEFVGLLTGTGRVSRAAEAVRALERRAAAEGSRASLAEALLARALAEEERGELDAAIATYDRLEDPEMPIETSPWTRIAALSNRGHDRCGLGHFEAARADLETAARKWREMGNRNLFALVQVWLADLELRRGRLERAHELLDSVEEMLGGFGSRFAVDCYDVRSRVFAAENRLDEAAGQRAIAVELHGAHSDLSAQAASLAELALLERRRGRWGESAECARRADERLRRLTGFDSYRASSDIRTGERENARAGLLLTRESAKEVVRARDLFRAACSRSPSNLWYSLNLSYAAGALKDWTEAADAVDATIAAAPDGFGGSVLHELLARYRLRQGAGLVDEDDYAEAERVCATARRDLAGRVPDELVQPFARVMGDGLLKQGRAAEARLHYEEGVTLLPSDSADRGHYELRFGLLDAADGDPDAAAGRFRTALGADVDEGAFWWLVEECSRLLGPDGASRALVRALSVLLRDPEIGGRMATFTPNLRVPLPPGWSAKEAITLVAPDGRSNVTASSEPIQEGVTAREYADATGEALDSPDLPGFRELSFERIETVDGREAWLRLFEWDPPDTPSVVQAQMYFVDGGRGFVATATTTDPQGDELRLGQLLSGILIAAS